MTCTLMFKSTPSTASLSARETLDLRGLMISRAHIVATVRATERRVSLIIPMRSHMCEPQFATIRTTKDGRRNAVHPTQQVHISLFCRSVAHVLSTSAKGLGHPVSIRDAFAQEKIELRRQNETVYVKSSQNRRGKFHSRRGCCGAEEAVTMEQVRSFVKLLL